MAGCLPCLSGQRPHQAACSLSQDEDWTPSVLRELYEQSLDANDGRLIVYGEESALSAHGTAPDASAVYGAVDPVKVTHAFISANELAVPRLHQREHVQASLRAPTQ